MGILDEAIREHLELKRAHGADDSELKQLEDQAFGQAERPGGQEAADPAEAVSGSEGPPSDSAAEAPTEFMAQPDLGEAQDRPSESQESAPKESVEPPAPTRREPAAGVTDIQEPPEKVEDEDEDEPVGEEHGDGPVAEEHDDEPVAEEQPAAEHEAISAPPVGGHKTEERHAIADKPTEMFDVEEEFASTKAPAPPDEDLVAEELTEARLGPADPAAPPTPEPPVEDEDDDFFDEQRLSDELDQALEAPIEPEPEPVSDEQEALPVDTDEREAAPVNTEEHEVPAAEKRDSDEDVLEETPDFLEESPEDDELWFEQKPPKDFDFDD
jgi:hypothetical protein